MSISLDEINLYAEYPAELSHQDFLSCLSHLHIQHVYPVTDVNISCFEASIIITGHIVS